MKINYRNVRPVVYGLILTFDDALAMLKRRIEEAVVIVDNDYNLGLKITLNNGKDAFDSRRLFSWAYGIDEISVIKESDKDVLLVSIQRPNLVAIGELILRLEANSLSSRSARQSTVQCHRVSLDNIVQSTLVIGDDFNVKSIKLVS